MAIHLHTHAQLISIFKELCDAHTTKTSYEIAGYTYWNNPIWIFKIGNPNSGRILFDGCMHGWEDCGTELIYLFLKWLLTSNESLAEQILNENYWLVVPVLNYDAEYSQHPDAYDVRTNMNFTECTGDAKYGIDLNRNFIKNWLLSTPCDSYYSGKTPASEPETEVMRAIMNQYKPVGTEKAVYINSHYGGGPWIHYTGNNVSSFWIPTRQRTIDLWSEPGYQYPQGIGLDYFIPGNDSGAANGGAAGDGKVFGYNSFTIETYGRTPHLPCCTGFTCDENPTLNANQLHNCLYPIWKAFFVAVSEAVAIPYNPPDPGEIDDTQTFTIQAV